MYYKFDYEKLHKYIKETDKQTREWIALLDKINKSLETINGTSKISGHGADNIKSYFSVAHGLILSNLMELLRMHLGAAQTYEADYVNRVSSDAHTHVETKETENISKAVEKQRAKVNDLTSEINKTVNAVSDLVDLTVVSTDSIHKYRDKVEKFIKVLNDLINEIETDHSKNDFNITAQSIQRTKSLIISMQDSRTYPDTFDKFAFYSSKEFKDFYESAVKVDNAYNANLEQYISAAETHLAMENVYVAEREHDAELIRLGVVIATTAVGAIVAVATAGTATPLVAAGITAIVSAGSAAVTTAANSALNVYVVDGDLDDLDVEQTLRDSGKAAVIAGATSLVGSAVSATVTSGLTSMAATSSGVKTLGDAGFNSAVNSSASRIGTGVVIGSASKVVEGVYTRAATEFATDMIEWDDTGVHWSDENTFTDSAEKAAKKAFDPKEILKDAAYGGVSGGVKEQKAIREERYEAAVTKQENLKQELSGEELEYVEAPKPSPKHGVGNAYKTNSKSDSEIIQEMHDSGEWDDIVDYDTPVERKPSILTKELVGKDQGWKAMRNAKDAGDLYQKYKNTETVIKSTTKVAGTLGQEPEAVDSPDSDGLYDFEGKKIFKK